MTSMIHNILVLDDEPDIRELLNITLTRMGLSCHSAANLNEAYRLLEHNAFDLCLTDMKLPDGEGIELVEFLQQQYPHTPCAVITAFGSTEMAIRSLKAGAFDFISKPIDLSNLRSLVTSALQLEQIKKTKNLTNTEFIGESNGAINTRHMIEKLSRSQAPVHIYGESGTGKELVARLIHNNSPRRDKPFIAINCGAIPPDLMESEFFGHVKGSFTGAHNNKTGLFKAADGGTLFLDEIADLPLHMQVKLLRTIQERNIRPIGGNTEENIDVRILSATNKDLQTCVAENTFRNDLYFRLNVIPLTLPPLRDSLTDIGLLAQDYINKLSDAHETSYSISSTAVQKLQTYEFPGNVRELHNILERAIALSNNNTINPDDLIFQSITESTATHAANHDNHSRNGKSLESYLEDIEKQEILSELENTKWDRSKTAESLGLSARQLRYKLTKYGITK